MRLRHLTSAGQQLGGTWRTLLITTGKPVSNSADQRWNGNELPWTQTVGCSLEVVSKPLSRSLAGTGRGEDMPGVTNAQIDQSSSAAICPQLRRTNSGIARANSS